MSDAEPTQPETAEPAVTEPPRIPLRIWHWFVWIVSTLSLLVLTQANQISIDDPYRRVQLLSAVEFAISSGLALTAFVALLGIVRQRRLPLQVRWAPGHFMILFVAARQLVAIAFYLIGRASEFLPELLVFALEVLPYIALLATIGWFAIRMGPSLLWRWFHISWLSLLLGAYALQIILPNGSSLMWMNNLPSYAALVALSLLAASLIEDVRATPRPLYFRTWTHWAGIVSYIISVGYSAAWNLVLWQYVR